MYREIKKKKLILENRKPYQSEISAYIRELNMVDWIYSSMHLDGSGISREETAKIANGGLIVTATVDDHKMISNYKKMIQLVYSMQEMLDNFNEISLQKMYLALTDGTKAEFSYRTNNPVLYTLHYNPPHFFAIEEQLDLFFDWLSEEDPEGNPIQKAVISHNKLVEIYPFSKYNEAIARALLNYQLIQNGYPPILLAMSEQEYNKALAEFLKSENSQPLYEVVERCVFNKLDVLLQLTNPA